MIYKSRKWLIIGSVAMRHWFDDYPIIPRDIDIITPTKIDTDECEACVVDTVWDGASDYVLKCNQDLIFADPEVLLSMALSTAPWKKHDKHEMDVAFLLNKGVRVNRELLSVLLKNNLARNGDFDYPERYKQLKGILDGL